MTIQNLVNSVNEKKRIKNEIDNDDFFFLISTSNKKFKSLLYSLIYVKSRNFASLPSDNSVPYALVLNVFVLLDYTTVAWLQLQHVISAALRTKRQTTYQQNVCSMLQPTAQMD